MSTPPFVIKDNTAEYEANLGLPSPNNPNLFFKIPSMYIRNGGLKHWKPAEVVVFLAIKSFAGIDPNRPTFNRCWPSYAQLSNITGLTRTYIAQLVLRLEKRGVISVERDTSTHVKPRSNIYTILL